MEGIAVPKLSIGNTFIDRTILIAVAILVLAAVVGAVALFENCFLFAKGEVFLAFLGLLYAISATYMCLPYCKAVRRKGLAYLMLFLLQGFVILASFLLFHFGLFEFPERGLILWGLAVYGLAIVTSFVFLLLLEKAGLEKV